MKLIPAIGVALALGVGCDANAAKLVVVAINSGTSNPPLAESGPPIVPAGARGFLFAIDSTTDAPNQPLGFQDLTFSGPNIVQRLAPNAFANEALSSPNVQTRSDALSANGQDPVPGSTFGRNDSWWWNASQNGLTLAPVSTGIQGGLPGGPMTMTGTFNLSGDTPPGVWYVAYIVATGDFQVSGLLAPGTDSSKRYNVRGVLVDNSSCISSYVQHFGYQSASFGLCPEPSSWFLIAVGTAGFALVWNVLLDRHRGAN